jgi:hypothetical protein
MLFKFVAGVEVLFHSGVFQKHVIGGGLLPTIFLGEGVDHR